MDVKQNNQNIKGMSDAITPSDSVNINQKWHDGLLVTSISGGTAVAVQFSDGTEHTFTDLSVNDTINASVLKVLATGTTATVKSFRTDI